MIEPLATWRRSSGSSRCPRRMHPQARGGVEHRGSFHHGTGHGSVPARRYRLKTCSWASVEALIADRRAVNSTDSAWRPRRTGRGTGPGRRLGRTVMWTHPAPLTPGGQAPDQASSSNRAGAGNQQRTVRSKAQTQSLRGSHQLSPAHSPTRSGCVGDPHSHTAACGTTHLPRVLCLHMARSEYQQQTMSLAQIADGMMLRPGRTGLKRLGWYPTPLEAAVTMTPASVDHHQRACEALERSAPLLVEAIRRAPGSVRARKMRWTNAEIAAHMYASVTEALKAVRGEPSLYDGVGCRPSSTSR